MRHAFLILLAAGLALSSSLGADDELPEKTVEGLVRLPDSKLAVVYALPGADLSAYRRVKVLEPYVAFRKKWLRDNQNRGPGLVPSQKDMDRIKQDLGAEFMKVFTEVLEANDGYPVVDETGPDILIVRPAIINLNPLAPDLQRAGRVDTYAESAGEMTLYVEIYDSETSALIAKGLDQRVDRGTGYLMWTNRVTNRQAADRILKEWAEVLRNALDHARTAKAPDAG